MKGQYLSQMYYTLIGSFLREDLTEIMENLPVEMRQLVLSSDVLDK